MAFGSKAIATAQEAAKVENSGSFISPFMSTKAGVRFFQLLPEIGNNAIPQEPVIAFHYWTKVMVGGKEANRRVFVAHRYENPIRQKEIDSGVAEKDAKGAGVRFFLNVWDKTPVIKRDGQSVVYADAKNEYFGYTDGAITKLDGKLKEPNNAVMILEGSAGKENGKHMFGKLASLDGDVWDAEEKETLPMHMFGLRLKVTGVGTDTDYTFTTTNDRGLALPVDELATLARYDFSGFAVAWPNEALEEIVNGSDFNEVVKQFNIKTFPTLATPGGF